MKNINRKMQVLEICILIVIIILFLAGCTSQKSYTDSKYKTFRYDLSSEYFFYEDSEIYHISSGRDTTLLDQRDVRTLKIDSITIKYYELKGNEVRKRNDSKIAKEN